MDRKKENGPRKCKAKRQKAKGWGCRRSKLVPGAVSESRARLFCKRRIEREFEERELKKERLNRGEVEATIE